MVFMLLVLVIIGDFAALFGGAITGQLLLGVDWKLFVWSIIEYIKLEDFTHGLWKALVFGYSIGIISCYFGMRTSGGAMGVGRAVNASVVGSAIAIFVFDYFITYAMH